MYMNVHTYTYIQPDEEKNEKERDRHLLLRMYAKSHNGDEGLMKSPILLSGKHEEMLNLEGGGREIGKFRSSSFLMESVQLLACSCSVPLCKNFQNSEFGRNKEKIE